MLWGDASDFQVSRKHPERWLLRLRWRAGHKSGGVFSRNGRGWIGALGLEPTPDLYVAHLVEVMREVRRVMRPDATLWLNLGDSYSSGNSGQRVRDTCGGFQPGLNTISQPAALANPGRKPATGMKPKDLVGIPWRVALALQADGWWWRSWLPWIKWAGMPDSTGDRPGSAVEVWLMFSKSERCYWDHEAVRRPGRVRNHHDATGTGYAPPGQSPQRGNRGRGGHNAFRGQGSNHNGKNGPANRQGRKMRDVGAGPGRQMRNCDLFLDDLDGMIEAQHRYLTYLHKVRNEGGLLVDAEGEPLAMVRNPKGFPGAHFATFCVNLVAPLIGASTSERGCCPSCGAPWERVVERRDSGANSEPGYNKFEGQRNDGNRRGPGTSFSNNPTKRLASTRQTTGWRPTCECGQEETRPAIVLDPFAGSGTVGLVAGKAGRASILVDASEAYCEMMRERLAQGVLL
jgi:hypothetical protein